MINIPVRHKSLTALPVRGHWDGNKWVLLGDEALIRGWISRIRAQTAQVTILLSFGGNVAEFGFQIHGRDLISTADTKSAFLTSRRASKRLRPLIGDAEIIQEYWFDLYSDLTRALYPYRGTPQEGLPEPIEALLRSTLCFLATGVGRDFRHQDIIDIHMDAERNVTLVRINWDDPVRRASLELGNIQAILNKREKDRQNVTELFDRIKARQEGS